jgi:hypothetical protein
MNWKFEYMKTQDNIEVKGYSVSETDCRAYFLNHVSSKIAEADGAEQLRSHIAELETTGFDSSMLLRQTTESIPQVKDWEVGEAVAETVLEREHEAMFPWEMGWDKRTPKASLPGADIVGFQNKVAPRFIFGQVKSSSEKRVPPQIVNSGVDCLREQLHRLDHTDTERMQLIQWLLPRIKGTDWENTFNEALEKYSHKDYYLVGVLVSGGRSVNSDDLTGICSGIKHVADNGDMTLLGYYLPFEKSEWVAVLQGRGVVL